jgi:hypothetical protein
MRTREAALGAGGNDTHRGQNQRTYPSFGTKPVQSLFHGRIGRRSSRPLIFFAAIFIFVEAFCNIGRGG